MPDSAQSRHPGAAQLAAFAQGKLTAAERAALQAHLKACPACRQALAALPAGAESASDPDTLATKGPRASSAAATHHPGSDVPADLADHPRYEVLELLGQGGMGAVYKARHKKMDRLVALKVISARVLDNPKAVERFQREVKAAAKLEHPNIVRAYDADEAGGTHFLVMEFVEGTDLAKYVEKQGPLPVGRACQFIRQAALGLEHAHQHGMVHRDIKPHNLMLATPAASAPGVFTVKVMDFGLARLARERASEAGLTGENALMGTADYIAPEQAEDARTADIRADIYSLGCSLFHLLAGRPPLEGGNLTQKLAAHLTGKLPLEEVPASVPAELRAVLAKMVAKEPARRYQTPGEVAAALVPFLKKATGVKPPPLPADVLPAGGSRDRTTVLKPRAAKATAVATARSRPAGKPSWKRWLVIAGAGVAVLLVGIVMLWAVGAWRDAAERRRFSEENLAKLKVDMTLKELEEILGPSRITSKAPDRSMTANDCYWRAWAKAIEEGKVREWGRFVSGVEVAFSCTPSSDSKVVVIRIERPGVPGFEQKPRDKWMPTKDNFLKLRVGMTLQELEDVIGVGEPARSLDGLKGALQRNPEKWESGEAGQVSMLPGLPFSGITLQARAKGGEGWEAAVKEYRVLRWATRGPEYPPVSTCPVILAAFPAPPSAAFAAKVEALRFRDGTWDQDKGTLSGAKE